MVAKSGLRDKYAASYQKPSPATAGLGMVYTLCFFFTLLVALRVVELH